MEITALGAARQVGRSAFLLHGKSTNVLLDFGVMITREPVFPIHVQPKDIDAILLSHAHLDHSGAAPVFYLSEGVDLYTTPPTAEFTKSSRFENLLYNSSMLGTYREAHQ